ncbi:MAG: glycosyltransferase family 2 protein, partial [Bacteroidales bacterium]|nr:glycosyltransferase family 2 protein [Bacteroidales bacterium]
MKLIIQIPCYNEAGTLAIALDALPREVAGFDKVEWLIINDGSVDETVKVAKECGVDHIVNFKHNQGLAKGFMAGIQECLSQGADVIVNTDADNQYEADDIPKLTQPIIDGTAEYVVGARPISQTDHFSPAKKFLQKLGSWVVRKAS